MTTNKMDCNLEKKVWEQRGMQLEWGDNVQVDDIICKASLESSAY